MRLVSSTHPPLLRARTWALSNGSWVNEIELTATHSSLKTALVLVGRAARLRHLCGGHGEHVAAPGHVGRHRRSLAVIRAPGLLDSPHKHAALARSNSRLWEGETRCLTIVSFKESKTRLCWVVVYVAKKCCGARCRTGVLYEVSYEREVRGCKAGREHVCKKPRTAVCCVLQATWAATLGGAPAPCSVSSHHGRFVSGS